MQHGSARAQPQEFQDRDAVQRMCMRSLVVHGEGPPVGQLSPIGQRWEAGAAIVQLKVEYYDITKRINELHNKRS